MRRFFVLLGFVVSLGCSSTPVAASAVLVGAHDMVLVDSLLFTTSTDRDELRVLNVSASPGDVVRPFIRAPNPLEALSIPVLARPSALSRDVRFKKTEKTENVLRLDIEMGSEVGGPWIYATRAGGSEISVIGAGPASDDSQLSEVKRVPTSAPVTASAGASKSIDERSAAASKSKDDSSLFFATFDGEAALLQRMSLPGTVSGLRPITPAVLAKDHVRIIDRIVGEAIVELLVVPRVQGRGMCEPDMPADETKWPCLIFATRTMQGKSGRVVLLDPESLVQRELKFPGPVRLLAIHAATFIEAGKKYLPAGQRVFGVLDEARCGGTDCGGVTAVDTFTGEIALDSAGLPMIPISTGNSLPTGLAVTARGQLLLPPSLVSVAEGAPVPTLPTVVELSAVGVITTSTGLFVFFDANGLTPFDLDSSRTFADPIDVGLYRPDGVLHASDGGSIPSYVAGPVFDAGVGITFANGAWRSEVIDIVVNGLIPGLQERTASPPRSVEFPIPQELISRVQQGDTVLVKKAEGGLCRSLVVEVTGSSVKTTGNCMGDTYAVRAGGADPYLVSSTLTGYLGRSGPNRVFNYKGSYYQRTPPFDPNAPTFSVVLGPGNAQLEDDWRWSIDVHPADLPFVLQVSSVSVGCSTNVASSVLWDVKRQAIFSVFPSANAIIEVNPKTAANGTYKGGQCWR